ncbi:MAG: hypothetical protein Tsb0014_20470 [Pleurocapsa sp.]
MVLFKVVEVCKIQQMGKISINLDESSLLFLDRVTDNRSSYINELIRAESRKEMMAKLEADYREQSEDPEWREEVELWDCVASDGLDDSVDGMVKHD